MLRLLFLQLYKQQIPDHLQLALPQLKHVQLYFLYICRPGHICLLNSIRHLHLLLLLFEEVLWAIEYLQHPQNYYHLLQEFQCMIQNLHPNHQNYLRGCLRDWFLLSFLRLLLRFKGCEVRNCQEAFDKVGSYLSLKLQCVHHFNR